VPLLMLGDLHNQALYYAFILSVSLRVSDLCAAIAEGS